MDPSSSSDEIVTGETEGGDGDGDGSFPNSFDGLFDGGELSEENDGDENVLSSNSSARQPKGLWAVLRRFSRLPKVVEGSDLEMGHGSNGKDEVKILSPQPPSGILRSVFSGLQQTSLEDELEDENEDIPVETVIKGKNYFGILFQLSCLVIIVSGLICTLTVSLLKKKILCGLEWWKWEILALSILSGRVISSCMIQLVVCCLERIFVSRSRVLYFVYGVRKNVQNCFWIGLVLVSWECLFAKKVGCAKKMFALMGKVLMCLFVGMFLWVIKSMVVKGIASWYHIRVYFDQIQEAIFHQYLIEVLSGPTLMNNNMANSRKLSFISKLNTKNISFLKMKQLAKMIMHGSLHGQIMDAPGKDDSHGQNRSENEAKIAAKKIFQNVAKSQALFITLEDLSCFLPKDEALKTINLVEGSPDIGKINEISLNKWVVDAFLERRALASRLSDSKSVVSKLSQMLSAVVGTIIVLCCLNIFGLASTRFYIFLGSQIFAQGYIYGDTLKVLFVSLLFIFGECSYAVGDLCEMDDEKLIVEEINICTTVFSRFDRQKMIVPNYVLRYKPILRHSCREDTIDFTILSETPSEKINSLKQRVISFIENIQHWYASPKFVQGNSHGLKMLQMSLLLRHRVIIHDNLTDKWHLRAEVVEEMTHILKALDIYYHFLIPCDITNVK